MDLDPELFLTRNGFIKSRIWSLANAGLMASDWFICISFAIRSPTPPYFIHTHLDFIRPHWIKTAVHSSG